MMKAFSSNDLVKVKEMCFKNMEDNSSGIGFDFNGQWITNPFLDASGRFELSFEKMHEYYGEKNVEVFLTNLLTKGVSAESCDSDGNMVMVYTADHEEPKCGRCDYFCGGFDCSGGCGPKYGWNGYTRTE